MVERHWEFSLPEPLLEDWMAVFRICMDESGKFDNQNCEFISMCGYVAHTSEWERIQLEWSNCVFRWQIPPIHMAKIMHPEDDREWKKVKEDWGTAWEDKRDDMLAEFAELMRRSNAACVGAVVDAKHFRSLPESPMTKSYDTPLKYAFHSVVMRGMEKINVVDRFSPISLVIDDDRDTAHNCHFLLNALKIGFPQVRERISGICFVNDRYYPGVQAADMISYESRRLMVKGIIDPLSKECGLFVALTFNLNHQPKLFDSHALDVLNNNSIQRGTVE